MSKAVSILYEIHPHAVGGTERFLMRLLERLNPRRYEPIVVSQKNGKPLQLIHSMGIRTEVIPDYFRAAGGRRLAEYIRLNGIGLVQSNYYSSNLAIAANLAHVTHIWRLGGHVSIGSGARNKKDAKWVLDIIRLLSKSIICNSNYVRSQFSNGSNTPPMQVIPNGIAIAPLLAREQWEGNYRVGMIAHFTPQKRHIDFIRAAELVSARRKDVSFGIVGRSYSNATSRRYAAEVRLRSRRLRRQGKLRFSDSLEFEDNIPGRFDVIVLPSVHESFSNAILEAMAAGVPVIAASSGGNSELVQHQRTGLLVAPMRPETLAEAMLEMIENPKFRDRMGKAAVKRVRTRFSIDDCARSYEAVYSKVLIDRGRR